MPLDKVQISLDDVNINVISNIACWELGPKSESLFGLDTYSLTRNSIKIKFYMTSPQLGRIFITFNPIKLKFSPIYNFNRLITSDQILALLDQRLSGVFTCNDLFRRNKQNIKTSHVETNLDVEIDSYLSNSYLNYIAALNIPRMKKKVVGSNPHTVYFYTGKSFNKAKTKIKIYNKTCELKSKGIRLGGDKDIIRFEIIHKRRTLLYKYKRINQIVKEDSFIKYIRNIDELGYYYEVPSVQSLNYNNELDLVCCACYQFSLLDDMICNKLHLDKEIISIGELIQIIKDTNDRRTPNIINFIKKTNGLNVNWQCHEDTARTYKKFILDLGYHYICCNEELPPMNLDMMFKHVIFLSNEDPDWIEYVLCG